VDVLGAMRKKASQCGCCKTWLSCTTTALRQGEAYLVLDEELDTLNGSGGGLGNGGRDTTHCVLLLALCALAAARISNSYRELGGASKRRDIEPNPSLASRGEV